MKKIKRMISLLLLLSISTSLLGCGKKCKEHIDEDLNGKCDVCDADVYVESPVSSPAEFTVKVVTEGGMPVKDAMVYVHKSDKEFDVACKPVATNSDGIAEFHLEEGQSYSVQLDGLHARYAVPDGGAPHGRYAVNTGEVVIKLAYASDYQPSAYALGDKLPNYTVTDVNGQEYSLYSLLETKDMIMLNFWFINCAPCRAEFPAINAAYNNYASDVAILAINNTDSSAAIKAFPDNYGISVDFPLISVKQGLNPGYFGKQLFPTTVIVDRYGVVCFVEDASIPSEAIWNNMFAYFTADNYTQRLFTSIYDIPTMN